MDQPERCPECDGPLNGDRQERACRDCGLVVAEDRLDRGPEWRSFERKTRKRTGAPLTRSRHDRGLSTEIGHSVRLSGRKRRLFARLRRQHNRARMGSKAERNRVYAFNEIRRLVGTLGLETSFRDRACVLFESAQSAELLQGRSIEGFAAAAVYVACRTASVSRTLEEIVVAARAEKTELTAAYKALNRELGVSTGPIDPREYVGRFADRLELEPAAERRARELVGSCHERGLVAGHDPSGIAAACLYTAATESGTALTQATAANVADVTPVTIRSTYHELREGE